MRRRSLFKVLGELIFPQGCLLCERLLSGDDGPWCADCAAELLKCVTTDYCPRCGAITGPYLADSAGCPACRDGRLALDGVACVGLYQGALRDLIRKYKYGRQQRLDHALAALLAEAVRGRPWAEQIDALVPVPTNWRGRWRYRFHPAGLLAAGVGRQLARPVLPLIGVRGKKRRQVELPETLRPVNVRGVFYLRKRALLAGTKLCILDDVNTTGSTLREMARVLKRAGAAKVFAATLAKTRSAYGALS